MAELTIGGETFNIAIDGADGAPALLMSNSLGTNLSMWDPQIPALSKRFRVIRYDSRGHGASPAQQDQPAQSDAGASDQGLGGGGGDILGQILGGVLGGAGGSSSSSGAGGAGGDILGQILGGLLGGGKR